jgi:toxin ParE1/3/4
VTVRVLTEAESEVAEAAQWYEEQREGLGLEFLDSFSGAVESIEQHPQRFLQIKVGRTAREVRRALFRRFPYKVVFEVRPDEILILAVAHDKRRPYYWKKRLT